MPPNVEGRTTCTAEESPPAKKSAFDVTTAMDEIEVSFSHIHFYVDTVEDVAVYKDLEEKLNTFDESNVESESIADCRERWLSMGPAIDSNTCGPFSNLPTETAFHSEHRDIVKQLLTGFGFRVTAFRMMSRSSVDTNTKTVLVTSKDPKGVQFVVSAIDEDSSADRDEFFHFDAGNIRRFYAAHNDRQGIAVLSFRVNSVSAVARRYRLVHPALILHEQSFGDVRVLEVYAFYKEDTNKSEIDEGTVLRFVQTDVEAPAHGCILPGLTAVGARFEGDVQSAYCDHWVSNVVSRTGFLRTLSDTLGFAPKVDFNAGVVAAGEAQIESTVTGNQTEMVTTEKSEALADQSQVYLPINNALSEVGHVYGFLREIGQGIQHVASRVDDLVRFTQRANDRREITGEGFTFLKIPRSYYGVLSSDDLVHPTDNEDLAGVSLECANAVMKACKQEGIASIDGAVSLDLAQEDIELLLESNLAGGPHIGEYRLRKAMVLQVILRSRYANLYKLLRHHLSEEAYLGLVHNQILVDVQGDDLLYQIFTCNVLQRRTGDEAPFLEFIQRVCSECRDAAGCPVQLKPGCGGFGVRNFLTLFLSIEVSKAMMEVQTAEDEGRRAYAQRMVDCFANQLTESNPILTAISDAMTQEGRIKEQLHLAATKGDRAILEESLRQAGNAKAIANQKLLECSTKYKLLMRCIREG